eukprot:CAMPEP_0182504416 /NCGR_PEP_ID=MMETSP1321-20130603/17173_1 /TAXON_ID=91990 /ORGANISM="Bolidomonas sp., Strain RCC1657" /LENGTH=50 /DNA_ID=CAMNT_0024709769 /DNA_START=9 /DNA_END=158 /DNA_ORIENTATION=-
MPLVFLIARSASAKDSPRFDLFFAAKLSAEVKLMPSSSSSSWSGFPPRQQ